MLYKTRLDLIVKTMSSFKSFLIISALMLVSQGIEEIRHSQKSPGTDNMIAFSGFDSIFSKTLNNHWLTLFSSIYLFKVVWTVSTTDVSNATIAEARTSMAAASVNIHPDCSTSRGDRQGKKSAWKLRRLSTDSTLKGKNRELLLEYKAAFTHCILKELTLVGWLAGQGKL